MIAISNHTVNGDAGGVKAELLAVWKTIVKVSSVHRCRL